MVQQPRPCAWKLGAGKCAAPTPLAVRTIWYVGAGEEVWYFMIFPAVEASLSVVPFPGEKRAITTAVVRGKSRYWGQSLTCSCAVTVQKTSLETDLAC